MERRHFISVAGGLGLGLLIPGVVYRYLMRAQMSATPTFVPI